MTLEERIDELENILAEICDILVEYFDDEEE